MGHDHAHGHDHGHAHGASAKGSAFAIGIGLNVTFVVVETVYGILAGSMALVADAAHNLSDVLGLVLAWAAIRLARRRPTSRRTYGFRKTTVLSALTNAVLLLVAVGGIAWEAIGRFEEPAAVEGGTVMLVAGIGVVINGLSATLFARGSEHDVNLRGAFLHLAADAAVSLGVVGAGFMVMRTGLLWIDPAVSVLISLVVLVSTWSLLKNSLNLALDAVPAHIDPDQVRTYLSGIPGVHDVHDLHIWAISTTEVALTAHLLVDSSALPARFHRDVANALHERFGIAHPTLQLEPADERGECALAPDGTL